MTEYTTYVAFDGTEFDDEYYSKQYGEIFPKKKKKD